MLHHNFLRKGTDLESFQPGSLAEASVRASPVTVLNNLSRERLTAGGSSPLSIVLEYMIITNKMNLYL